MEISVSSISYAKTLECPNCKKFYDIDQIQSFATCCNQPLLTVYEQHAVSKKELSGRPQTMWRYLELLPVFSKENIVSLGEGWTKVHELKKLSSKLNINTILIKDESTTCISCGWNDTMLNA